MRFIQHQLLAAAPAPRAIAPSESAWVDDLGRTVRPVGLKARCGIRERFLPAIEAEAVPHLGTRLRHQSREISARLRVERHWAQTLDIDFDPPAARRPYPEV